MNEPVEDGIRHGGVGDGGVPVLSGNLADHNGRPCPRPVVDHLQVRAGGPLRVPVSDRWSERSRYREVPAGDQGPKRLCGAVGV